jgi:transcription antitermination factor NusG
MEDDVGPWPRPDPLDPDGRFSGHGFVRGDRVRIASGPFEGFDGLVDLILPGKVRVIVRLFGSPTPVDMPFDEVERI